MAAGGADGGPAAAAQPAGAACWAAPRPTTSCCWTTASRCRTTGATPRAFDQAKAVVQRIGDAAAARATQPQTFTLLRFSRAGQYGGGTAGRLRQGAGRRRLRRPAGREARRDRRLADGRRAAAGPGGHRRNCWATTRASGGSSTWSPISAPGNGTSPTELKKQLARLSDGRGRIAADRLRGRVRTPTWPSLAGAGRGHPRRRRRLVHGSRRCRTSARAAVQNVPVLLTEDDGTATAVDASPRFRRASVAKEQFPVNFAERRRAPHRRPAGGRRRGGRQLPLRRGRSAGRDARAAGRRRPGGARRPTTCAGPWRPAAACRRGIQPRIETPRFLARKPLDDFRRSTWPTSIAWTARPSRPGTVRPRRRRRGLLPRRAGPTAEFINEELYRDGKGLFPLPLGRPGRAAGRSPGEDARRGGRGPSHFIFHGLRREAQQLPEHGAGGAILRGRRRSWRPQTARRCPRARQAAQRRTAGRRAEFRQGPRDGLPHHGRADVEQLGPATPASSSPCWNCRRTCSRPADVVAAGRRAAGSDVLDPAEYQPQVRFVTPMEEAVAAGGRRARPRRASGWRPCPRPIAAVSTRPG